MAERDIQHAIRLELGKERDLDLERRTVGMLKDDKGHPIKFGTVGEADLQGVLALLVLLDGNPVTIGRFFALEVKIPGKHMRPEQRLWAERKRMRGGFVAEVHSVEEAVEALARARTGARE